MGVWKTGLVNISVGGRTHRFDNLANRIANSATQINKKNICLLTSAFLILQNWKYIQDKKSTAFNK